MPNAPAGPQPPPTSTDIVATSDVATAIDDGTILTNDSATATDAVTATSDAVTATDAATATDDGTIEKTLYEIVAKSKKVQLPRTVVRPASTIGNGVRIAAIKRLLAAAAIQVVASALRPTGQASAVRVNWSKPRKPYN